WITNNYFDVIEESLLELNLDSYQLRFLIDDTPQPAISAEVAPPPAVPTRSTITASQEIGFAAGAIRAIESEPIEFPLNPKYTFDTFVVGSCNQFAHAASLAVVDMPSKTYNPLYVYGGVGLGKTHLMHAIGQAIKQRNQSLRLTYLSSERFMNELIN